MRRKYFNTITSKRTLFVVFQKLTLMCLSSFCIEWMYIFALICDFSFISRFFLNILSVGSDCNEMREQCILICCSYFAQKRDAYWPFTSFCTKIVLTSKLITAVKLWADHCYFEFVLFVLFTPKKYCSLNWGDQQLVLRDSLHLYNLSQVVFEIFFRWLWQKWCPLTILCPRWNCPNV